MGNRTSCLPLPSEIMTEIFLLLPLESVLACKVVCKEWKDAVKDSYFIKQYKADATPFFLDGKILKCVLHQQDKKSYDTGRIGSYAKSNCELLLESSNKIVCVKTEDGRFLLYNLLTGDLRAVVDAPARPYSYVFWSFIGFGYDSYEDDYKIIVICKSMRRVNFGIKEHNTKCNFIFIYSYKNSSWETREGFEDNKHEWSVRGARGFAVNGVLHWIVTASDATKRIAGLDLNSYGLAQFRFPPISEYDEIWKYSNLTSFKGRLCCFVERGKKQLDVWLMEEYGVTESWTMLLRIEHWWIGVPRFGVTDMRIYQDGPGAEIGVFIHNQVQGGSMLFGYDNKQSYIKTLRPDSHNKNIRADLRRLKTRLKQACCII